MRYTFTTLAGLSTLLASTSAGPIDWANWGYSQIPPDITGVCFFNGERFRPPAHYKDNYNKCIATIPHATLAKAVCQTNLEGLGNWADEAFLGKQIVAIEKAKASCLAAGAQNKYQDVFLELYRINPKCVIIFQKCEHRDRPDGLMACIEKVKHVCLPRLAPPPELKNGTAAPQNGTAPGVQPPQNGTASEVKSPPKNETASAEVPPQNGTSAASTKRSSDDDTTTKKHVVTHLVKKRDFWLTSIFKFFDNLIDGKEKGEYGNYGDMTNEQYATWVGLPQNNHGLGKKRDGVYDDYRATDHPSVGNDWLGSFFCNGRSGDADYCGACEYC